MNPPHRVSSAPRWLLRWLLASTRILLASHSLDNMPTVPTQTVGTSPDTLLMYLTCLTVGGQTSSGHSFLCVQK